MSELTVIHQLAPLASQHHLSDYSRVKHGPNGSSYEYIPLCLHMPSHYEQLEDKKMRLSDLEPWWPCKSSRRLHQPHSGRSFIVLGPSSIQPNSRLDLQDEIAAAMETTFPPLESQTNSSIPPMRDQEPPPPPSQIKTSVTHPINISMIIPDELLPIISDQITYFSSRKPTWLELPPRLTLDRYARNHLPVPIFQPHLSIHHSPSLPPALPSPLLDSQMRRSVTEALHAAISCEIATSLPPPDGDPRQRTSPQRRSKSSSLLSLTISITPPRPSARQAKSLPAVPRLGPVISKSELADPVETLIQAPFLNGNGKRFRDENLGLLGNLYMSSCPGKKVRLTGPIKGRSAVCRDLDLDLARMRDLGVRCIICCLDDDELEFLGAPWKEYSMAAANVGLDILRLPTPEGLAPLTPALLDVHLSTVISKYTLQGLSVLVHCRGGVGRAGVVACCWMLKMGLCGWLETDYGGYPLRRDTIQLVERALCVVRRQRSVKAVETYEQVKFIADYVDFLREQGD